MKKVRLLKDLPYAKAGTVTKAGEDGYFMLRDGDKSISPWFFNAQYVERHLLARGLSG